ncbi:hypothetical protein KY289_005047 [Solanum tuberosum]|nr:hypothetical protein KY289_005047 [Solanum tuberosum]
MEDNIYFAVGFKAYDISRTLGTVGAWYDWTERNRKSVTRTTFNEKTMEWIVQTLREASLTRGNTVKRWKKKDSFSEVFCSRNYNKFGRYISLINVRGRRRGVIIIPELAFNSGWLSIAEKVGRFINSHKKVVSLGNHRLVNRDIPYATALRSIKWANKGSKVAEKEKAVLQGERIFVKDEPEEHSEVLKRSLVGVFEPRVGETTTLAEIRGWANRLWKQTHSLNIYEMGNGLFLFEFALRVTAEQVIEGDWEWRNKPVTLHWWNPTIGTRCGRGTESSTWVRILGLPLQFWDQKIFKAMGRNRRGNPIEKSSQVGKNQNQRRWSRHTQRGDHQRGEICYTMQIWTESPVRVFAGEDWNSEVITQRIRGGEPLGKDENLLQSQKATNTVGKTRGLTEEHGQILKINKGVGRGESTSKQSPVLRFGPEQTKKGGLLNKKLDIICDKQGSFLEGLKDIKELASQFLHAYNKMEKANMVENNNSSANHNFEEYTNQMKVAVEPTRNKAKEIDQPKDVGENSGVQKSPEEGLQIQQIHDVEPVSIQSPRDQTDAEVEAANWVSSHILELSRTYGVAFEGFRGETHALLMKLDERKREMEKRGENSEATTSRQRGIGKNELKNLQSDLNEEVEGETKISKDVDRIAKQLWASRWMRCGYIEADGSSGRVLVMWDSRIWVGSSVEEGKFSITYKFEAVQDGFCWFLTGVYAPHTRTEKLECWEEIAAVRELCGGPWVTCGDFNTVRTMAERRGCRRITNVMTDFSRWIEDMELHDPCLRGGIFTWFRGPNHHSAARLDRFLCSTEWEEQFRNIRQTIMPRVISDHCPLCYNVVTGNKGSLTSNSKTGGLM